MSTVNPVIRRSHTKSKNGCQTCRARHMKCDEFRPHCRNCLLARRSCKYLTALTNAEESSKHFLSLTWPVTAERSCRKWKDSGEPPFPFLQLPTSPSWHHFSLGNLRHMHHLALLASILELSKTRKFCLWWSQFSIFFQLALKFEFVAYAIMAHSSERLALVTKLSTAFEDTIRYRSLAIQGLNKAIDSFSKDSADAILCASLCLSNQETDWRAWMSMMEGMSAVIHEMQPWIRESLFARFLDRSAVASEQRTATCESSNMVNDSQYRVSMIKSLLAQGISALNELSSCSKEIPDLSAVIRQLRDTCRIVYERPSNWSLEDQFRLVHPFASWMDKYTRSYVAISEGDSVVLATFAHFFAVAVTLVLAFPGTHLPLVAPIRLGSIIEIDQVLRTKQEFFCGNCRAVHSQNDLMAFPLNTVYVFRELQGCRFPEII